jgi:DNA-binding response OmpR family regulator
LDQPGLSPPTEEAVAEDQGDVSVAEAIAAKPHSVRCEHLERRGFDRVRPGQETGDGKHNHQAYRCSGVCYPRLVVGRVVFLTDRSPAEALPAVQTLGLDVKTEPLAPDSVAHLPDLAPSVLLCDGEDHPDHAFRLLSLIAAGRAQVPVVAMLSRADLDRFPWHEVADDVVHSGTPAVELKLRLAMLARRTGGAGEAVIRLGPLSMNTETYQVFVGGRVLDLTFKEFEVLRFLIQRPGRVFTRGELLTEVWGYNFYGGTRTVDVHVRRLRAKLGPEYEGLIQTVRGVGYRAAEPRSLTEA